ncbi:hypothetical protein IM876_09315 [Serratia plymuthica]|uniref:hypothetical protein n=1 Tax=Serratia plymuthica TaxID=82996 RepID=UPI001929725F|nr:hypothetical protein [Serratia plymuthica]MBL3522861.1 hypothetical protein [Serratia plymuthica]
MGIIVKPEVKFAEIPEFAQQAALDVIVYRLTTGEETGASADEAAEDTKRVFLKLYE